MDPFHAQIILQYLKSKTDFINFISIKTDYQYLLDRFRINPIPITKENKNLFQFLDTQQIFKEKSDEIILDDIDILQINYKVNYSQYLKMKEENKNNDRQLIFKKIVYSKEDRKQYGNKIPKEITILGKECFEFCNEKEILIPSNVKQIKDYCFSKSDRIENIIIPDSVTKMSLCIFDYCFKLTSITLSTNLLDLDFELFENCKHLKNVTIPPYITKIKYGCFENCALEEIEIPSTVESLEDMAFKNCYSLTKIDLSKTTKLTKIEKECFKGCSSLSKIEIPTTVEEIERECFENCSSLQSITIPSLVKSIKKDLLKNCTGLEELIILNKNCKNKNSFFEGCKSLTKIDIPTVNGYCSFIVSEEEQNILERNGIKVYQHIYA